MLRDIAQIRDPPHFIFPNLKKQDIKLKRTSLEGKKDQRIAKVSQTQRGGNIHKSILTTVHPSLLHSGFPFHSMRNRFWLRGSRSDLPTHPPVLLLAQEAPPHTAAALRAAGHGGAVGLAEDEVTAYDDRAAAGAHEFLLARAGLVDEEEGLAELVVAAEGVVAFDLDLELRVCRAWPLEALFLVGEADGAGWRFDVVGLVDDFGFGSHLLHVYHHVRGRWVAGC